MAQESKIDERDRIISFLRSQEFDTYSAELVLSSTAISDKGAVWIAKILGTHSYLKRFILTRCYLIRSEGFRAIAALLVNNSVINELDLSFNIIEEGSAKSLAEMLEKNNTLKKLKLEHSNMKNHVAILISSLIKNSGLEVLDLSCNDIDESGVKSLAEVLINNKTVKVLILRDCKIHNSQLLAKALEQNDTLIELNLSGDNYVTEDDFRSFVKMIEKNTKLEKLHLTVCKIEGVFESIFKALKKNNTLRELYLKGEYGKKIDHATAQLLIEILKTNTTLTHVEFELDIPDDQEREKIKKAIVAGLQRNLKFRQEHEVIQSQLDKLQHELYRHKPNFVVIYESLKNLQDKNFLLLKSNYVHANKLAHDVYVFKNKLCEFILELLMENFNANNNSNLSLLLVNILTGEDKWMPTTDTNKDKWALILLLLIGNEEPEAKTWVTCCYHALKNNAKTLPEDAKWLQSPTQEEINTLFKFNENFTAEDKRNYLLAKLQQQVSNSPQQEILINTSSSSSSTTSSVAQTSNQGYYLQQTWIYAPWQQVDLLLTLQKTIEIKYGVEIDSISLNKSGISILFKNLNGLEEFNAENKVYLFTVESKANKPCYSLTNHSYINHFVEKHKISGVELYKQKGLVMQKPNHSENIDTNEDSCCTM